tara:strand:+ start:4785 stop:5633 length:849 start_codon:yes stop_codon:yes gene_type:complete
VKRCSVVGVVIVYNPGEMLINNISSYACYLDKLIIWMNSSLSSCLVKDLADKYKDKLILLGDGENKGLSFALNSSAKVAEDNGAQWLLTMDQDSYFSGEVGVFFDRVADHDQSGVAVVCPRHVTSAYAFENDRARNVPWVMTSGNLVSLSVFDEIGGFDPDFFIDGIDIDFCLKAVAANKTIIIDERACLIHELGEKTVWSFWFIRYQYVSHSPVRYYYIFRNYLVIMSRNYCHARFKRFLIIILVKQLVKSFMFEPRRFSSAMYICRGVFDFINKNKGKVR